MDKRLVICGIVLLFAIGAKAQQYTISGSVQDTAGNNLENVTIWCYSQTDSIGTGTITNSSGYYELKVEPNNSLTVRFSHIGYETQNVSLDNQSKKDYELNIVLQQEDSILQSVEVTANVPLGVVRNDTTVYYASAYKVHTDATAYDLIAKKLPGISYRDGKLEAHGEQVKEIMVDGKEFFKNDVVMALKNLPASIIREVQLFDKETDYARITGFDEENTQKTINIVTKDSATNQVFGKILGGYGTDAYYKGYGMINSFQDERRMSIFAQSNNVNEQNFSTIELLSAMGGNNSISTPGQSPYSKGNNQNFHPSSGDAADLMTEGSNNGKNKTNGFGLNYIDEMCDGKIKVSGHYMYNSLDNNTNYEYLDEYFVTSDTMYQQEKHLSLNRNNRLNLRVEYIASPNDIFIFKPSLTFQDRVGSIHQSIKGKNPLTTQERDISQEGFISMNELDYLHRVNRIGNSIGVNVKYSFNQTQEHTLLDRHQYENDLKEVADIDIQSKTSFLSGTMSYLQVLNRYNRLKFELGGSENVSSNERGCYKTLDAKEVDAGNLNGWVTSKYQGVMSNISYIYNRRKLNLMLGSELHLYTITNISREAHYQWRNYKMLPYAQLKYKTEKNKQFYLQYKTNKIGPSAFQLQETVNEIDPLTSIKGNMELAPSYKHTISIRYIRPNIEQANIFIFFINYEAIQNYMAYAREMDIDHSQRQYLTYVNMDGYKRLNALTAYGFPVNVISSNVNFSSSFSLSQIPAYLNGLAISNNILNWNNSITIGSNISENVDFVIDVNAKYYNDRNKSFPKENAQYWALSYGGQLNWSIRSSLKLTLEGGQTQYKGIGVKQYDALICNAAISYKFLRQRKAEIRISINDMFNQNNNFAQITNEIYKRTMTSNVIGQYAMLTFTYNL